MKNCFKNGGKNPMYLVILFLNSQFSLSLFLAMKILLLMLHLESFIQKVCFKYMHNHVCHDKIQATKFNIYIQNVSSSLLKIPLQTSENYQKEMYCLSFNTTEWDKQDSCTQLLKVLLLYYMVKSLILSSISAPSYHCILSLGQYRPFV